MPLVTFTCPVPCIPASGLRVCSISPASFRSPSSFPVILPRVSWNAASRWSMLIPLIRASALKLAFFFATLTEKSPVVFPPYASALTSVKKAALDSSRNLEFTFVVSTAPKRKRLAFQLPCPASAGDAGLTIAATSTLSSSLVMSWASKNTGPGASEGSSRFDTINCPR